MLIRKLLSILTLSILSLSPLLAQADFEAQAIPVTTEMDSDDSLAIPVFGEGGKMVIQTKNGVTLQEISLSTGNIELSLRPVEEEIGGDSPFQIFTFIDFNLKQLPDNQFVGNDQDFFAYQVNFEETYDPSVLRLVAKINGPGGVSSYVILPKGARIAIKSSSVYANIVDGGNQHKIEAATYGRPFRQGGTLRIFLVKSFSVGQAPSFTATFDAADKDVDGEIDGANFDLGDGNPAWNAAGGGCSLQALAGTGVQDLATLIGLGLGALIPLLRRRK